MVIGVVSFAAQFLIFVAVAYWGFGWSERIGDLLRVSAELCVAAYVMRGHDVVTTAWVQSELGLQTTGFQRNLMFVLGLGILVAVPAIKTVTHLPPCLVWATSRKKTALVAIFEVANTPP